MLYFLIKVSWKFLIAQKQLNVIQLHTCFKVVEPIIWPMAKTDWPSPYKVCKEANPFLIKSHISSWQSSSWRISWQSWHHSKFFFLVIESDSEDEVIHDRSCRKRYKFSFSDLDIESSSDHDFKFQEQVQDKTSKKRFTKKRKVKEAVVPYKRKEANNNSCCKRKTTQ